MVGGRHVGRGVRIVVATNTTVMAGIDRMGRMVRVWRSRIGGMGGVVSHRIGGVTLTGVLSRIS